VSASTVTPAAGSWTCGMCGNLNPKRRRGRCARCGAVRGMGSSGEAPLQRLPGVIQELMVAAGERGMLSDEVVAAVRARIPGVHVPSVRSVLSNLAVRGLLDRERADDPGRPQRTGVKTRYRLKGGAA
jgi:hypothetical protein